MSNVLITNNCAKVLTINRLEGEGAQRQGQYLVLVPGDNVVPLDDWAMAQQQSEVVKAWLTPKTLGRLHKGNQRDAMVNEEILDDGDPREVTTQFTVIHPTFQELEDRMVAMKKAG